MKAFFVGLIVLISLLLLSILGAFLLPFILVMGLFLKAVVILAFAIFAIWLIGKITLYGIDRSRRDKVEVIEEDEYKKRNLPPN